MRESGHKPLSERVYDIADAGAIRFGKLWLDKEEQTLHWSGSANVVRLGPSETEVVRLLMAVSHRIAREGGIISPAEFQGWFDELRKPTDDRITSANQIAQQILRLRVKLKKLTADAIGIETEGISHGARGYFLKERRAVDESK